MVDVSQSFSVPEPPARTLEAAETSCWLLQSAYWVGSERGDKGNLNQLMRVLKTDYVADVAVGDPLSLTPRLAFRILPDGVALSHPEVVLQRSGSVSGSASVASASP